MYNQEKQKNFVLGKRQEIAFKVEVKDGIVQKIHNAYVYHPKLDFRHDGKKVHADLGGK